MYYVYVLKNSQTHTLYIGSTNNLKRRITEHIAGRSQTTRRLKTTQLIFYEAFLAKKDALRREKYFKTTKGKSSLKQIIRHSII